jgi:TonB family protein
LYRAPDAEVSCEWVVLLDDAQSKGVVLEENEDARRYFVANIAAAEAEKLRVSAPPPVYPQRARETGVQGSVQLSIHVSSEGHVDRVAILKGPDALQSAARDCVQQWIYKPLTVGAIPVPFQTTVTVTFRMGQ